MTDGSHAPPRGRALPAPGLAWRPGRAPSSTRFADIYHSRDGGLAETRHVFLAGNGLPRAWQGRATFAIGELGFGTGLNFLAAWDLWRRTKPPAARLHYVAVEGYPLTPAELADCLAPWPEVAPLAHALARAYPSPQRGFHRAFPADDVCLTLLFGEAGDMLAQLEAEIDAWFLDGFAPDRNPEMWRDAVFAEMARLSRPGASLATYSVAGRVRRGLDAAGFDVARAPGFGAKREMLTGRARAAPARPALQPWFAKPAHGPARGHAAVIGGGLAGAHVVAALRRHGWTATLIERHPRIPAGASAVPRAVMAPRLTATPALDGRFHAAAWRFALARLDNLGDAGASFGRDRGGSLQLAVEPDDAARFARIADAAVLPEPFLSSVSAAEASDSAGLRLPLGGLLFPQGGSLEPSALCAALTAGTDLRLNADVAALDHAGGLWRVAGADGAPLGAYDAVVLGNALGVKRIAQAAWLPLEARRGQASLVPAAPAHAALRAALLYGGYLTPAAHGLHTLGATFDPVDPGDAGAACEVRAADHARNLADLSRVLPGLLAVPAPEALAGFAGLRCMSPDHLPVAGPVPDRDGYLADFAGLRHGHPWARYPRARYHHGLYVLTALGARGLVSAPLAAELIASYITGAPWPLERDLVAALHPARFLVRALKRGTAQDVP